MELTASEKFIWEWMNVRLGGFKVALLSAIQEADIHNLEKLRLGFPDEVEGWVSYKQIPSWWPDVQRKSKEESCPKKVA